MPSSAATLIRVARERQRVLGPAVFVVLAVFVFGARPLGIEPPTSTYAFDIAVVGLLGLVNIAIVRRWIPRHLTHLASAMVLWCPMAATLSPMYASGTNQLMVFFLVEIASAGVILHTRLVIGTVIVANACAIPLLLRIGGPYGVVFISSLLAASAFAMLIHTLMRRALVRLANSEETYRALVESSPDAMFVQDDEQEIRWVNASMCHLLGYPRGTSLLGTRASETFVHPDDRARLAGQPQQITASVDARWVAHDGTVRHVQVTTRPILFENAGAALVVAHDMTAQVERARERAKADAAIRESEERYRLLFDSAPMSVWVFDSETLRFTAVNDKMIAVYGYSRDEFLSMTVADIKRPEDMPFVRDDLIGPNATRTGYFGITQHRRKDGSWLDIEITGRQMVIGGRRCWLALGVDITESRRLEDQLRQTQRMDSIGQLAGGVAHDFNNILAVIMSNAGLLAESLTHDPALEEEALEITAAAERGASLTRQLLAFSRKQHRQISNIALNAVVTNIEKMLCRIVGEDVGIKAVLDQQLGTVRADKSQLEQVLMNLVVNARDAMPDGGRITIETSNTILDASRAAQLGLESGRHVLLAVTDTGVGMTAAISERIFEPFFTTKEVGKGTGLGLATVFGIVKQSDGAVCVDSAVGRGTTFSIYLPRADAVETVIEAPRAVNQRGTETILVVEDDAQLRAVVHRQLQGFGYRTLQAADPLVALSLAQSYPDRIDLVLTDLVMPGLDGRTLAARIVEARPMTQVLFMSGYSDHAAIKTGIGVNDLLLEKPFTPAALSAAVRRALGQSSSAHRAGAELLVDPVAAEDDRADELGHVNQSPKVPRRRN